ncbi:hypothetical protein ACVZYT_001780 [Yersinia enterocolitica]
MSKIERYAGNLRAFGSNAQGLERTLFGETTQGDDLTSQITNSFLRGWGIVGPSENPSMEDFNAAMYTMSQFIAYQHQMGIPEWDALQEYYSGSICVRNGEAYLSLVDSNIGSAPPSAKWTSVLTAKNALANISGFLKSSNNLSEIKDAGPAAVAQTLLNLGLGDVVRYGTFGTLPSGAMTVLPGGDFNLAPSGWCAVSAATVNAPYNPINGTIFTWGSAGASSTGLLVPPSVGVAGQKWYQVLFDEAQAIYTRQRIGTGAWTDWQQIAHPKYFFVYPDGTSASPYVYPVNTRKEYTNPFPGKYLNVVAEVQVSGIWGAVPYVFAESSLQGIGIQATQINGNGNIVVQSGTNKVAFRSLYQGNPFGITADVGASPFRLKISNVGDL